MADRRRNLTRTRNKDGTFRYSKDSKYADLKKVELLKQASEGDSFYLHLYCGFWNNLQLLGWRVHRIKWSFEARPLRRGQI